MSDIEKSNVQECAGASTAGQAVQKPIATQSEINPRKKYKNILYGLGIVEVILGVLSITFCIVSLIVGSMKPWYEEWDFGRDEYIKRRITYGTNVVAQGIWCGVVVLVSGIFGILTKKHTSSCMHSVNIAISITSSFFMGFLLVLSVVTILTVYPGWHRGTILPYNVILAIIGFFGMIISSIHFTLSCVSVCCQGKCGSGSVTVAYQTQPGTQQIVQVPVSNNEYMIQAGAPGSYPMMPVAGVAYTSGMPPQTTTGVVPMSQPHPVPEEQEKKDGQFGSEPPEYSTQTPN